MKNKITKTFSFIIMLVLVYTCVNAQDRDSIKIQDKLADSAYINETESKKEPLKILHAEPLYIDLIRDLGARKGEKEWNVGLGLTDNNDFDTYTALVEYEFAPVDRLGFEVELPFSFYYRNNNSYSGDSIPRNRLQSLKLATQYSFFVSDRLKTSMAIGYIHEFELAPFQSYGKERVLTGHVFNPFFVAAKRWGKNFHTLIYTGPYMTRHFDHSALSSVWQTNTSFHYMIPGTRNFIGIEFNKEMAKHDFDMTIRPQLRVSLADNLMVGIVTGIPIRRENERFSSFLRLIYEPKHKHH